MRASWRSYARTLVLGTVLGLIILGAGGRIVMAMIAADAGGTARFTVGGTMTVVFLGGVSGLAGAVMAIVSRAVARRFFARAMWLQYVLLAGMLLLVTMRGLRGAPPTGSWYFYPLVALYGLALVWFGRDQSQRPSPFDSEYLPLPSRKMQTPPTRNSISTSIAHPPP